jgi:cobalt-zinc-cadmium efflux system protein
MAHDGHSHEEGGHSHNHSGTSASRLSIALALTGSFFVGEVVGGLVFKSLALLSDAAHMFTDVTALVIALVAIKVGMRAADDKRTFGYRRLEILAAAFNAILLFGVAIYVLIEGVRRFFEPVPVGSTGMMIIAVGGLAINLVSMKILTAGKEKSLNVKSAYLEVWADMIGSVGVIVGATIISITGLQWVDPVIAIGIGLWVLPRTWILLKDSTQILLEGAPRGLVLADIRKALQGVEGVKAIHDLHIWVSGADQPSCSLHVELSPGAASDDVRTRLTTKLKGDHGVSHVTIQTETMPCDDQTSLHP